MRRFIRLVSLLAASVARNGPVEPPCSRLRQEDAGTRYGAVLDALNTAVARTAKLYGLPIVLSTVNVASGRNEPTIHQLAEVLDGVVALDRTAINAWEDSDFVAAVEATGRLKLIMAALWTEVCLVLPALDATKAGYDVYPVVDAVAGTSEVAHRAGLERI